MVAHQTARVVIGSNFGDEGKGLLTDAYAADDALNTLVVRFNGGGQAGHTVVTPDDRRHVFKHVGSGALAGASTLLARDFIVNPLLFFKERVELLTMGVDPRVFIDPTCLVTTPYDMLVNKALEDARSGKRHGSCGVGINETVTRSEQTAFGLRVMDLADEDALYILLQRIRKEWGPHRLESLGVKGGLGQHHDVYWSDTLMKNWVHDAQAMLQHVTLVPDAEAIRAASNIVFEGAQGLQLDEMRGFFPHVTRSRTGVVNAARLALAAGLTQLDVTYVTRCYLTRHGAGPLPGVLPEKPFPGITDRTNMPNDYQGELRFALLNVETFKDRVLLDLTDASGIATSVTVAMTCVDQLPPEGAYWMEGRREREGSPEELLEALAKRVHATRMLTSQGPTREDVKEHVLETL